MKTGRFKTIWNYGKKCKFYFIAAEICLLVTYAISILLPLNFTKLVDEVFNQKKHDLLNEVIYGYVIMFVTAMVFNFIYAFVWQRLYNRYIVNIKTDLFSKIISLKAKYLSDANTGDLTERIENDCEQFLHIIQRNVFHFINSFILIAAILVMICSINIVIGLIIFLAALLPILFSRLFSRLNEALYRESREIKSRFTGKIYEAVNGLTEIKNLCAEWWVQKELFVPLKNMYKIDNKVRYTDFKTDKSIYIVNLAISLVVYAYSIQLIIYGRMTPGIFLALIQYIALLHRKLNWMLRIYLDWNGRKVSIDRVNEILALDSEEESGEEIGNVESVEFRNVCFKYDETNVLNDVSFTLNKGERVAVVGESGEGKTTVTSLLLKLYEPNGGEILINGKDIWALKTSAVRERIGVVQQENILFNQSIRYNITLGDEGIDDNEIGDMCKKLGIYECIYSLPQGLDTVISKKKSILSGGEKQRLKIARLLLQKHSMLIFDEAASALDTATERSIVEYIMKTNTDAIILMISHRKETVSSCERLIALKGGRV